MTNPTEYNRNWQLLTDYTLGRLEPQEEAATRQRLQEDADLQAMQKDVSNALSAIKLCPIAEPPQDLVDKTLARIRATRRTEALLTREQLQPPARIPTFSLRELAAIAAAVVVMAAILVPSIRKAKNMETVARCASQAGQIGTALRTYANANNGRLPYSSSGDIYRWLPIENAPAVSNSEALFRLVSSNYLSPVTFQCPATGGGSFVVQAGMNDFPAGKYITYSYQYALGDNVLSAANSASEAMRQFAILSDSNPLFENAHFRPDRSYGASSRNHSGSGQNVLYMDMHVGWAENPLAGVSGDNIFLADGIYDYRGIEKPAGPTDSFLLPAYSGK